MVEHGSKLWKDGRIVARGETNVSVLTHTLHYGVGAFEGIRAYRRQNGESMVFRLREHIDRLFASCKLVQIEPRVTVDDVCGGCIEVLRQSGLAEGYLRPIVLLGEGTMGLLPVENPVETLVMTWTWGAYLGTEGLEKGIRCKVSSYARAHPTSALPRGKIIGQYVTSVLAKREVKAGGYDEALLLDGGGHVCEGSGENLFVVSGGELVTPPRSTSILAGITRDTVLTLAREEGVPIVERPILRDELYLADEVFLTGTAAEVTPVREVDDRKVGAGSPGPVTKALQRRFFDIVRGTDDSHPEWLTRV